MTDAASRPHEAQLYGLALLVQLIWALNNSISKLVVVHFPGVLLAGLRYALGLAIMLPIYWWRRPHKWEWRDVPRLLVLGAVGLGLNQLFFVIGIKLTSVTHAALIIPLTPMITLALSSAMAHERFTTGKVVGMLIAFSGVVVLQLSKGAGEGATVLGDFCILLGIIAFAIYIVFGKGFSRQFDSVLMNTFALIGSVIVTAPVAGWQAFNFDFSKVPMSAWAGLFYMTAFSSILGYLIYYYVLTHMAPSRISTFSYVQPILTSGIATMLVGEPITLPLVVSGLLVLAGVYFAERSQ